MTIILERSLLFLSCSERLCVSTNCQCCLTWVVDEFRSIACKVTCFRSIACKVTWFSIWFHQTPQAIWFFIRYWIEISHASACDIKNMSLIYILSIGRIWHKLIQLISIIDLSVSSAAKYCLSLIHYVLEHTIVRVVLPWICTTPAFDLNSVICNASHCCDKLYIK